MTNISFPARIPSLVRMLASPADGEVLNAARALARVLAVDGLNINDVADALESHRAADQATPAPAGPFTWHARYEARNSTSDYARASWLARHGGFLLSEKEREFVGNLAKQLGRYGGRATYRQAEWLGDIWARVARRPA